MRKLLACCSLAAWFLAAPALADIVSAEKAWAAGDFARAWAEFKPLAEAGDPLAQFYMGHMLSAGSGVAMNLSQALAWYRKSAEQGYGKAQNNLGIMYASGKGAEKDTAEAQFWFHLASTSPDKEASENGLENLKLNAPSLTAAQAAQAKDRAAKWRPPTKKK